MELGQEDNLSTETAEEESDKTTSTETAAETEGQEVADNSNKEEQTTTEALETKGFDYAVLQKEYNENGDITKETRAELHKVGITDEIIDNFIDAKKVACEAAINELAQCVGGRENYNSIIEWAGENLSEAEKLKYNKIQDKVGLQKALKELKEKMEEKEGVLPDYITGDGNKPTVSVFESQTQMMEAIKDPKYAKDPAYRNKVRLKIQASKNAGIDLGI